jgi:hypothetical protein
VTEGRCSLAAVDSEAAEIPAVFADLAGAVIASVRRLHYVYQNKIDRAKGPIEFRFRDGRLLRLDCGPDGEALAIFAQPWVDPFRSPLSSENAEFVARSGKWTQFDVSADSRYSAFIGSAVTEVVPIRSPLGKVVGVDVVTPARYMKIECNADELWVTFRNAD